MIFLLALKRSSSYKKTESHNKVLNINEEDSLETLKEAEKKGILKKYNVEMIGAKPEVIEKAEGRHLFKKAMQNIGLSLPNFVVLEVKETAPGEKGNTVTGALKSAVVTTGYSLNVPLFINEGDHLKIDTRNGEYVERVKNQN